MLWKPHHLIRHTDQVRLPRQAQDRRWCCRRVINVGGAGRRVRVRPQFRHRLRGRHRHPGPRQAGRRSISTTCARTSGSLGVGEVSLQEFGDNSTALIRVQRQEGNAQCVAHADARHEAPRRQRLVGEARPRQQDRRRRLHRAQHARRRRLARRGEPGRPHPAGAPATARQRQHRAHRHDASSSAPNGASRWRSSWSRTRSGDQYEIARHRIGRPQDRRGADAQRHLGGGRHAGRDRDLCLVPLRMAVRRRRPDRAAARRAVDRRHLRAVPSRLQPDRARRRC